MSVDLGQVVGRGIKSITVSGNTMTIMYTDNTSTNLTVNNQIDSEAVVEIFNSLNVSSLTVTNSEMHPGRYTNNSSIVFRKIGKLVVMDYHLEPAVTLSDHNMIYVCNFPEGYIPSTNRIYSTWVNSTAHGQVRVELSNGVYQIKVYCLSETKNMILGQMVYFTE